jgi:hypothetical protein
VGPFTLQLEGGWARVAAGPGVASAGLPRVRTFAPAPSLPGRVWIARVPVRTPSLIPTRVLRRVDGRLGPPRRTRLAGRPAWVYDAIAVRGGGLLALTVQPTTAGALVVGCQAPGEWWSALADCARGIAGIDGPAPLSPVADLAYRLHARTPLARLNARRAREGHALHRARSARAQARSARRLAASHAAAASALHPYAPRRGAARRVVVALRRSRAAYAAVARSARRRERRRYATARRHARRADAALARALRRAAS